MTYRKLAGCIAATMIMCSSTIAHALSQEYGLTIANVGAQDNTLGYIRLTAGASTTQCPHNVVYLDLSTDAGRARMSIAITAKASGLPISRVDYENNGVNCWVSLLEL